MKRKMKTMLCVLFAVLLCVSSSCIAMAQPQGNVLSKEVASGEATNTPKLSKTSVTLYPKKTCQLSVTGTTDPIIWKSSNTAVVTVNSTGKLTAKKVGTAAITAKVSGKTLKCKVTVKKFVNYAKTGYYRKFYSSGTSAYQPIFKPKDELYVKKISNGKITFDLLKSGTHLVNTTGTITTALNRNVVNFKWTDSYGNNGTGKLVFSSNKVKISMNVLYFNPIARMDWPKTSYTIYYKGKS